MWYKIVAHPTAFMALGAQEEWGESERCACSESRGMHRRSGTAVSTGIPLHPCSRRHGASWGGVEDVNTEGAEQSRRGNRRRKEPSTCPFDLVAAPVATALPLLRSRFQRRQEVPGAVFGGASGPHGFPRAAKLKLLAVWQMGHSFLSGGRASLSIPQSTVRACLALAACSQRRPEVATCPRR